MSAPQADGVSYGGIHARLRAQRGPARSFDCVVCLNPADEWAYVGTRGGILPHGDTVDDYAPMCRKHHREHDQESRRARKRAGPEQDFLF